MKTKGVLTLTCRKCTRQQRFAGREKAMAVAIAKAAGWTCEGIDFFCGRCPKPTVVTTGDTTCQTIPS